MLWTLLSLAASLAIILGLVALALVAISVVVLMILALMAAVSAKESRSRNAVSSPG